MALGYNNLSQYFTSQLTRQASACKLTPAGFLIYAVRALCAAMMLRLCNTKKVLKSSRFLHQV